MASSPTKAKNTADAALQALFAERVRHYRTAVGLTQEELSRKAGLASAYAGRVESGVENPRLTSMGRLARALKVPVAALLTPGSRTQRKSSRR